nr:probable E3 SUMO-protein ligase RNF212 [Megalopta genalis]
MDTYICNKCYATTHRGRQPFCLTQCGHIYCQECIRSAEKHCPQCQQVDIFSVELQQPSLSSVQKFFVPINESLESLNTNFHFQYNQIKIVIQRFLEMDKKYELLKACCYNLTKSIKFCQNKCNKLQMENIELLKKAMSLEVHDRPVNSSNRRLKTRHIASTSTGGTKLPSTYKMFNDLRIANYQSVKSCNPHGTTNIDLTRTF